jgi:hypothetical protein
MRRWFARRALRTFNKHYGYDTSYMEMMLDEVPAAFFRFAGIMKIARYRQIVPIDAYYAAKIIGALAEDCGPCTQLVVDMALESGMPADQVEAVLRRDPGAMNGTTVLGFRFAEAIARRLSNDDELRDAVEAEWGKEGVVELTLALQVGRIFPMVKAGLGYARECRRVTVDGHNVDVIKQAA